MSAIESKGATSRGFTIPASIRSRSLLSNRSERINGRGSISFWIFGIVIDVPGFFGRRAEIPYSEMSWFRRRGAYRVDFEAPLGDCRLDWTIRMSGVELDFVECALELVPARARLYRCPVCQGGVELEGGACLSCGRSLAAVIRSKGLPRAIGGALAAGVGLGLSVASFSAEGLGFWVIFYGLVAMGWVLLVDGGLMCLAGARYVAIRDRGLVAPIILLALILLPILAALLAAASG